MTRNLHVRLLGSFGLTYRDAPVHTVNTARLQALLAYLILHRDVPQSRRHLAFLLWPDSTEAQARTNLRNLVHLLRRALPAADEYLRTDAQTIQWITDSPFTLDVAEMDRLVDAGALEEALALYHGDLLPSCYDDWIVPVRERLRASFINSLEQMAQQKEGARDYPAAIAYAQRLLQCDPLSEQTYRHLMRLHALNGDRAAAIHTFHTCATVLQRELSVEPGTATRRAYEALLRPEPRRAPAPLPAAMSLVGREREWAWLLAAWRAASGGFPQIALITGEAGIGKTRLVEEMVAWTARQGISSASANCYAGEGSLAYAPVASWLRALPTPALDPVWLTEVARLRPEVLTRPGVPPPTPLTEPWQRQRLFEALARAVLAANLPQLLVIEDLQWCDRDTLEWLRFLLRFDPRAPLLIAGTLRSEEVENDHPLRLLLAALRQGEQLIEAELAPLSEAETARLAAQAAGHALEPSLASYLYRETEGNPLFVVETVRANLLGIAPTASNGNDVTLSTQVRAKPGTPGVQAPLPPRVRAAITGRLEQLSPPARRLLGVAATVGREFSFGVLMQADGGDEESLVRALDELWQRRIVRERSDNTYEFSHHKLREVAYADLSAARRRLLHHRVAEALEGAAQKRPEVVAYHYTQAQDWQQAVVYHLAAAEQARRVYAYTAALAHLDSALTLAGQAPLAPQLHFQLLALHEETLQVLGEREAQARDLAAMAGLAREAGDALRQAEVYRRQARLMTDTGRFDEAEAAAREALALADGAGDNAARAAALMALGTAANLRGEPERAIPHLRAAAELEAQGADQQSAAARYALANALLGVKEYSASRDMAQSALAQYEAGGDQLGQAEAHNLLGIIAMEQGAFDEAGSSYRRSLEICRAIGYRSGEARAVANWGNVLYFQGRPSEALAQYDKAATIFGAIGQLRGGAIVRLNTASIRCSLLGDAEAAQRDIEAVLAYARSAGDRACEEQAVPILGTVARLRGDLAEARCQFEAGLELLRETGERWLEIQVRTALVQVMLDQGQPQAALANLEAAEALGRELGAGSLEVDLLVARAAVLLALGQPQEACIMAAEAVKHHEAATGEPYQAFFVYYRALLALGKQEEARAALRQARQVVLDLIKGLSPREQRLSLERQPGFRAILTAWQAGGPHTGSASESHR